MLSDMRMNEMRRNESDDVAVKTKSWYQKKDKF